MTSYTVPGLDRKDKDAVVDLLQRRLASYNDLHLTLKHVHWNVVGRSFIGVHEMLDPQVELVRAHLADARAKGARALAGGELVEHGGTWCPPTVLVDVTDEMAVVREESFATVLPVMVVADEEEAIARANATEFGLSAAVFSGDRERAERVARRLHAGGISINDAALTGLVQTAEKQSFKCSGMGGSRMGTASIRRFVRARALLVNTGTDSPWWFPPAA